MKHAKLLTLVVAIGIVLLVLLATNSKQAPEKPNSISFLSMTNGTVGLMATTYQTFSTNHAAQIQQWLNGKTNAALVRVTNNQNSPIWMFPFAEIESKEKQGYREALLLDAPDFSGIWIAPGETKEMQVAVFSPQTKPWRIHVSYTREANRSIIQRIRKLPEDLKTYLSKQPHIEHTSPMVTDWIEHPTRN